MKKSLAKKITLSILAGAVLMSSSVAWAAGGFTLGPSGFNSGGDNNVYYEIVDGARGENFAIAIGRSSWAMGENSIAIGLNPQNGETRTEAEGTNNIAIGSAAKASGYQDAIAIGAGSNVGTGGNRSIALGAAASVGGISSVASVALGYGSVANEGNVVSIGSGVENGEAPATRRIINVTAGTKNTDAVNVGQMKAITGLGYEFIRGSEGLHYINNPYDETLTGAVVALDKAVYGLEQGKADTADTLAGYGITDAYTQTYINENFVRINTSGNQNLIESSITIRENNSENPVTIDSDGITVGTNSARIDGSGFYVWDGGTHTAENAKASMTKDGKIKGASGKFEVGADGSVKAAGDKFKVDKDGNVTAEKITAQEVEAENLYTKAEIDEKLGGSNASVAGINQRLEKTNAKINKVGAGAAALAALHPLEYDPDDKLTFSAGMGNYAGENAAALGAFYRPNEKFMLSLGGTMGNGENMVNLGISIGLDKASGFAKLSKRELIQKVNVMEAKYEQVEAENEAMKAEMAEMKAMLQELLAKK